MSSTEQRERALDRANEIRMSRAALKRRIKAGQLPLDRLIMQPPECIETMPIIDLLVNLPRVQSVKARKMLGSIKVSAMKPVGELTVRERRALGTVLARRAPR